MHTDKDEVFSFTTLVIVLECVRYLSRLFMSYSNRARDYGTWPPLYDLLWDAMSPLTWARQFLSSMLTGTTSRLLLIYGRLDYRRFEDWLSNCPEQVWYLRRLILLTDSMLALRHKEKFMSPMLQLACVGDRRRKLDDRKQLVEDMKMSFPNSCCVPPGKAREWMAKPSKSTGLGLKELLVCQ